MRPQNVKPLEPYKNPNLPAEMSAAEYLAMMDGTLAIPELPADPLDTGTPKRNKYHAIRTKVDGIWFDSRAEATRYSHLKLMQDAGKISGLECHPSYRLHGHTGMLIATYVADFTYWDIEREQTVIEDVKSGPTSRTPTYRRNIKMLWDQYGLMTTEVMMNGGKEVAIGDAFTIPRTYQKHFDGRDRKN